MSCHVIFKDEDYLIPSAIGLLVWSSALWIYMVWKPHSHYQPEGMWTMWTSNSIVSLPERTKHDNYFPTEEPTKDFRQHAIFVLHVLAHMASQHLGRSRDFISHCIGIWLLSDYSGGILPIIYYSIYMILSFIFGIVYVTWLFPLLFFPSLYVLLTQ